MNYTSILFGIFVCVFLFAVANATKFETLVHGNNCEFISNDEAIFRVSGQYSEDAGLDFSTHISPNVLFLFMTDMVNNADDLPPCDVIVKVTRLNPDMKIPKVDTFTIDHKDIKSFGEAIDTIFMKLSHKDIFEFESLEMARNTVRQLKFV
jgi:hypothetical protein